MYFMVPDWVLDYWDRKGGYIVKKENAEILSQAQDDAVQDGVIYRLVDIEQDFVYVLRLVQNRHMVRKADA